MMPAHVRERSRQRILHVIQGEFRISRDVNVVLATTLGSCVAACLRDAIAGVGGMNHFLLPQGDGFEGPFAQRYGAYAMELLINALLRSGARRERLEVKLFGGARLSDSLPDVGAQNIVFAERFLEREGIALGRGCVGGRHARRLQFWPATGRVRQLALPSADHDIIGREAIVHAPRRDLGRVEFFDEET